MLTCLGCYFKIFDSKVHNLYTVEPVFKDHIGHAKVVSQDRWPLVTGSIPLKCRTFCQDMCSFKTGNIMAVVSQS